MTRAHIFIATPCYGGMVGHGYMQSVIGFTHLAGREGVETTLAMLAHDALITRSRNTLVGNFLASSATHLLFVDADISFHPSVPLRLLRSAKDVVAGIYPIKTRRWEQLGARAEEPQSASLDYVGAISTQPESDGDFVTADYAGTGLMMIARGAIDALVQAYPERSYTRVDAHDQDPEARFHALFDCAIDETSGTYLSEDFFFCRLWRGIGGRIWLDRNSVLTHTGGEDFTGDPSARFLARQVRSGD